MANSKEAVARAKTGGFTLLELLVVIAVIGILIGILLPVLSHVRRNAKESATRAFMKSIETACAAYEFDWGFYPPDAPTAGLGKNKKSSESLYFHLTTPFKVLPNAARPQEKLASKDSGPYLDVPEKYQADTNGNGSLEILDVWGRPFQFDNLRDPVDPLTGQTASGYNDLSGVFAVIPADLRADGTVVKAPTGVGRNPQKFDIYSNGEPTGDASLRRPIANFKCLWEDK